jgi:hypothetical protein
MGVPPEFPKSPYAELIPEQRWFPAAEELRAKAYERLLPPLVARIRDEVYEWRKAGYEGASETPKALRADFDGLKTFFGDPILPDNGYQGHNRRDDLQITLHIQDEVRAHVAVGFKVDYVGADGDLSNYIQDFIVRTASGDVFIIETKGREEIDLPRKMRRMKEWCADTTSASRAISGPAYRHVFVDQEGFEKHTPRDFAGW